MKKNSYMKKTYTIWKNIKLLIEVLIFSLDVCSLKLTCFWKVSLSGQNDYSLLWFLLFGWMRYPKKTGNLRHEDLCNIGSCKSISSSTSSPMISLCFPQGFAEFQIFRLWNVFWLKLWLPHTSRSTGKHAVLLIHRDAKKENIHGEIGAYIDRYIQV